MTYHFTSKFINLSTYSNLERDDIQSSGYVIHSLEAALWAFYHTDNYRDGALLAVNLGNDTIAAIYGQLAGAHYGSRLSLSIGGS